MTTSWDQSHSVPETECYLWYIYNHA